MVAPTVFHRQACQPRQVRCREEYPKRQVLQPGRIILLENGPGDIKTARLLCDGLGELGGLGGPIGRRRSQWSIPESRSVQTVKGRLRYHRQVPLVIFLLVILLFGTPAASAPPSTIEVVLDVSAGMHRPGVGGSPIYATVREALVAVVAEASAARPNLAIGLRLAGGDPSVDPIESCSTTSLGLPPAEMDQDAWIRVLDDLRPHGYRPLISSVLAALGDLDPSAKNRRIVVVTSGDDQCGNGPQQVVAALAAADHPAELRMVGLGLDQSVLDRFGGVPIRNAASAEELIDALRWAILDQEDHPRPNGHVALQLSLGETEATIARVEIFDQATGEAHPTSIVGEARLDLPAGRYRLAVIPDAGGQIEFRNLLVSAGAERTAVLDLGQPRPITVGIAGDPVFSRSTVWIDVAGSPPPSAELQFVDAAGATLTRFPGPFDGGAWLDTPAMTGSLDLVVVRREAGGFSRVVARQPVTMVLADPGLTAPDELGIGEDVVVSWSALVSSENMVGLVGRDAAPTDLISCISVNERVEGRMAAPPAAAELDLILIDGVTLAVAARHPLLVTEPEATVTAPARVAPSESIEVAWVGPEGQEDFVSLAHVGSQDLEYLEWARVEDGNPSLLRAPSAPGEYELRYVDGEKGEVRARAAIKVTAVPIELEAPATATAGVRFEIVWAGPATPGDIISISKPGAAPNRFLEWASITEGSPLTLAAPSKPGTYEVRYVARNGSEILAQIPIEVRP